MLRSVRHRPTSLAFPNSFSRDCLETPDGHQTGATQADTEGRGDRIFALQASDLASLTPLQPSFQTVSLRRILRSCCTAPVQHLGPTQDEIGFLWVLSRLPLTSS